MRAFITGVTGQDGYYLSKLLLSKGYEVFGLVRRVSQGHEIPEGVEVVQGDMTDPISLESAFELRPDETYNLAAMAHVGESFKIPVATIQTNTLGCLYLLECIRRYGGKFYQASTSEMFGDSLPPQNEETAFRPRSPYGISKLAAYWLTRNYREAYGLFACNGILFNHESPRRGEDFVTRKICKAVARGHELTLGNIDASRDWGHAEDFVMGMWQMLQQPKPDDYVLATGISRTVKELLMTAGYTGRINHDERLERPLDVEFLRGDATKARTFWKPKWDFDSMIREMVKSEISKL